ncbi:methyl-accepting chemotaxis protein [Devosia sp.]|uniref:methyl-accepting chemotaxis protein n=1 Tax=Devosia sp. TaxID=1871048 RepID=UPI003BA99084
MGFFNKLKIGTKVAMASGLGILLVLVLLGGTTFFLNGAKLSVLEASDQAAAAHLLTGANEALQAIGVASRDIRLALKPKQIPDYEAAADKELGEINDMLTEAVGLMQLPEDVARAQTILEQAKAYRAEVGKLAKLVSDELSMGLATGGISLNRQKLIDSLLATSDKTLALADEGVTAANARAEEAKVAADTTIDQVIVVNLILGALVLMVLAFSLFFILRAVAKPIRVITGSMNTLAEGHLDEAIPYTSRGDEIGEMAAAVKVFQVNAIKVRELNDAEAIRTGQTRERAASMTQLMDGLATAVNAAVDGDFTQRIALSVPDEDLQAVAKNVNDLLSTVDAGISETGEVLAALAQTDLTMRMQGEYRGAFAKLKADTNAVVDNLSDVVGQLRHTSGGLKTATGEILAGANDLAERTTKQAAAIEETSAAMEQLSTTVIENAKRAEQASSKAQNVSDTAALTGEVMTKSNAAMERISSSSAKISNIIGLIDDIAFQTNLLALNASVEAARAGDAGKGFAVVAVEVRRLAQSAASASSEVKVLIEQSAGEVSSGSKLVAEATQKLIDMLGSVKESAELIKDISSASREQSNAIAEVSGAIRQMDEMTQHNAALVEQTNAAIEQTESQANELDTIVDRFVVDQHTSRTATPAPAARPAATPPATGIKALQQKVKAAANSYLSKGNAALKEDWNEF